MKKCKFKPGDRVVNTSFASKHEGVGGTVMQVQWIPNRIHLTGTAGGTWQLTVILDTAELFIIEHTSMWEHEQDFINCTYIPF